MTAEQRMALSDKWKAIGQWKPSCLKPLRRQNDEWLSRSEESPGPIPSAPPGPRVTVTSDRQTHVRPPTPLHGPAPLQRLCAAQVSAEAHCRVFSRHEG
jgi:hypothetical protein